MKYAKLSLKVIFAISLSYIFIKATRKESLICKCILKDKENTYKFMGYVDTGNLVKAQNGQSVIIINKKTANQVLGDNININIDKYGDFLYLYNIVKNNCDKTLCYTFYKTDNKRKIMPILNFEEITIKKKGKVKKIKNPMIGFLDMDFPYALLPFSIIN